MPEPTSTKPIHSGLATSFADPKDVAAFKKCKAEGHSDDHCYGVGDNGEGCTGLPTTAGSGPSCAVQPEEWKQFGSKAQVMGKKKVLVQVNGRTIVCTLKDTMPEKKNCTPGVIIDLNPDACAMLGVRPPIKVPCLWSWL